MVFACRPLSLASIFQRLRVSIFMLRFVIYIYIFQTILPYRFVTETFLQRVLKYFNLKRKRKRSVINMSNILFSTSGNMQNLKDRDVFNVDA